MEEYQENLGNVSIYYWNNESWRLEAMGPFFCINRHSYPFLSDARNVAHKKEVMILYDNENNLFVRDIDESGAIIWTENRAEAFRFWEQNARVIADYCFFVLDVKLDLVE